MAFDLSSLSNQDVLDLVQQHGEIDRAAEALGAKRRPFRARAKAARKAAEAAPAGDLIDRTRGDVRDLNVKGSEVRTVADALKKAGVDTAEWSVESSEVKSWEVAAKVEDDDGSRIEKVPMWGVTVKLRRKKASMRSIELLCKDLEKHAPKYKRMFKPRKAKAHMLEMGLFDMHFGKLAWKPETGNNYDLAIAEKVFRAAVEDLVDKVKGFHIDKVVLPVGQDFFHADNDKNTTYAGTPQDVDGRLAKIFKAGEKAIIWATDYLQSIAPVHLTWVPGNHDTLTSWYLCRVMEAWYRHAKWVTVDSEPTSRKYIRYGTNLIGLVHGDRVKANNPNRLHNLMTVERAQDFADTKHHEWHTGHFHKQGEWRTPAVQSDLGTVVRILPSLCAHDKWHYSEGFVGGNRAAEAYLWSHDDGYVGHMSSPAIMEDQ